LTFSGFEWNNIQKVRIYRSAQNLLAFQSLLYLQIGFQEVSYYNDAIKSGSGERKWEIK
jgi:hypothetical protein